MSKIDIKLSGVGGQGILSIATVLGQAATAAGVNLKQAEVHGMSQRGGDVQSDLRLSTEPVFSDQIPLGGADLILSMEPMEALRYLPWLSETGVVVTSSRPLVNIPDYPDEAALLAELDALPRVVRLDIEGLARELQSPRSANMILLGMAAPYIPLLSAEQLRAALESVFGRKGPDVVQANLRAFEAGLGHALKTVSK
jgi:indolepyruvate ferredoxin oxidoreductase beta subunit